MQTVSKQKLSDLAKKRGIYAVLLVGVFVVVAVVMVMVTKNPTNQEDNNPIDLNQLPENSAMVDPNNDNSTLGSNENTQPIDVSKVTPVPKGTDVPKPTEVAQVTPVPTDAVTEPVDVTTNPEKTKPVMQTTAEKLVFNKEDGLSWPLRGNIIMPYSVEQTKYFATLRQYMVNPAIMIQGDVGAVVKAAATGIITDISEDSRTGHTITMDIGSDYKLVYGQLDKTNWKVGDRIEQDKTIGKLAETTKYYVVEGSHLYFQVYEGETTMDPMLLIKDVE